MSVPLVVLRAHGLLGRVLVGHEVSVRITEVEAYGGAADPASHAATRTARSEIMHGEPWRLYVYRSYGLHSCANVVTGPDPAGDPAGDTAGAVLLRAGVVVHGVELARARRGTTDDDRLARGPGNLASALGLGLADNGTDLLAPGPGVRLGPEVPAARRVLSGPRVGVARAADVAWRFWLPDEPSVSAYRRSPRAPAAPRPRTVP